jgi:hypothetical protein
MSKPSKILAVVLLAAALVGLWILGDSAFDQAGDSDPDDSAVVWFGVLTAAYSLVLATVGLALLGASVGRLIIGADKRLSTSKLQAVLWTYAVAGALLALLWMYVAGDDAGLKAVTEGEDSLPESYLLLLGGPFAAAVASKALIVSQIEQGQINKTEGEEDVSIGTRISEAVTDDNGNADLVDTQYLLFNLVALAYFLAVFLDKPQKGLPDIPDVLVGLAGIGALTYVTNKAVHRATPLLTSVSPSVVGKNETVTLRGRNLLVPKKTEKAFTTVGSFEEIVIHIGGRPVPDVAKLPASTLDNVDQIRDVPIPANVQGEVKVHVLTFRGTRTNELDLEVK